MRTYQTLGLIGGILGMLLTIGLFLTLSFFSGFTGALVNMTTHFPVNTPQQAQQNAQTQQNYQNAKTRSDQLASGLAFAFLFYIACIVTTFVIKNTKVVGSILLGLGVIALPITNFWGIIPFALLLPAGIVAIRQKGISKSI
jgi:hypothetical protein